MTIGNLGGSTVFCNQFMVSRDKARIECPVGTDFDVKNARYGMLAKHMLTFTHCL